MNAIQLDQTALGHILHQRHTRDADQQRHRRTSALLYEMRVAGFNPAVDMCFINANLRWAFFGHQSFRFCSHTTGVSFLSARLLQILERICRQTGSV